MPFEIMDQRGVSVSSHFFDEIPFPAERQVGFQKLKTMSDYQAGVGGMVPTPGSMLGSSMPSKMYLPNGAQSVDHLDLPQSNLAGEQTERLSIGGGVPNISKALWKPMDHQPKLWSDLSAKPTPYSSVGGKTVINGAHHESSLFSSSLSEIFSRKLRLLRSDFVSHQSTNNGAYQHEEEPFESLEEIEAQTIGNLLPDENDLFSGVTDELGYKAHVNIGDGFEDFDLFSSGGGMELEGDDQGVYNSSIAGEHPFGEHPSRTLFVRNINSNIEDLELKALFEQYGDIRALYTACKHRGFVMISYYDIRAAQNALRALQSKSLRHRKLDIHYSIPKDNPSDKDINQGTLVLFNLDSSVSNDELSKIFGSYGEIKEIRETPHKPHNKFIEFYDVRAAEAALHALNRSEIGGKQIKLEPSRPGGARRGLAQVSEQEQDEFKFCHSLSDSSSTGTKPTLHPGVVASSCMVNGFSLGVHSALRSPVSSFIENALSHQSSSVQDALPAPVMGASIGKKFSLRDPDQSLDDMNFGNQSVPGIHPHSLPEYNDSLAHGIPCNTAGAIGSMNGNLGLRMREGTDRRSTVSANGHLVELNGGAFGSPGNGSRPVHAHPYVLNNSNSYQQHPSSPMMWQNSPSFISGPTAHHFPQMPGFHRTPPHMLSGTSPVHHHVGSAPAVNPSLWERHAFSGESSDTSSLHLGSLGFARFAGSPQMHPVDVSPHNLFSLTGGNFLDMTTSARQRSSQEMGHMFPGRNSMNSMPTSFDSQNERGVRSLSHRRNEANSNNADKRQYELDIERIRHGEDRRTTLMIKNIPNKYTSKMLLAAIDEQCRGIYDFLYLPIDFKNKCNVGYAFINMIDPHQIVPFYKAFNGKKWEKFNSEKVASLAYARIQGKAALIAHFQNSSLMNEDKRCRPILFHTEGPNAGDPEPFPMGTNIRSRPGKPRTAGYDDNHHHGSPSATVNGEEKSKESERDLLYPDF